MALRRRKLAVLPALAAVALFAPATSGAATLDVSGGAIFYSAGPGESNGLVITQENGRYVFDEGFTGVDYDQEWCVEKQPGDSGWLSCETPEPLTGIVVSLSDESDSVTTSVPVAHTLVGGPGVDTLTGGPAGDALFGGDDGDTLNGGSGDDQFRGDDGLDMTPSVDTIAGQTGEDDTIFYAQAVSGVVVDLDAGTGGELGAVDQISGVEKVFGTSHGDDMSGTAGPDSLIGDEGVDDLDGRGGGDVLVGGPDGDTLTAGPDNAVDSLYGDDGDDHLFATDGSNTADSLLCGAGTDDGQADPSDTQFECENVALGGPVTPVVTLSHPDLSTNDTTPNLGGMATDHDGDSTTITVDIFAGGAATGSPVRTLAGTRDGTEWTLADEAYDATNPALPEGTYTARASQTNPGATPATALSEPLTFTVDTTAPAFTLTAPANNTNTTSTRPQIVGNAGTAPGDLGLEFYLERLSATGNVPVNSGSIQDGSWTMPRPNGGFFVTSVPVDLSVGTYRLRAWQEDAAGNRSPHDPRVFTITDSTPPALAINAVNPDEDAEGHITDATPHFSGAAGTAPGDQPTVLVYVDKFVNGSYEGHGLATANRSGASWSLDWPDTLADGPYRVRAWQSDDAGNASMVDTNFVVDRGIPTITILSPGPAAHLSDITSTVLSGKSSTGGGELDSVYADVSVNLDGKWQRKTGIPTGGGREPDGSWSINLGKLPPGYYYARVRLSDLAENEGWKEIVWFVDANQPPVVIVNTPTRDAVYPEGTTVVPTAECRDAEDGPLTCSGLPSTLDTRVPGPGLLTVSARDSRGVVTRVAVPYTVGPAVATEGILVEGIEVTQGTQPYGVAQPKGTSELHKPNLPFGLRHVFYNGVHLVPHKKTLARVFLQTTRLADVSLYVYNGSDVVAGPLRPLAVRSDSKKTELGAKQRDPAGGRIFNIPPEVVEGKFDVVAVAVPFTTPSPDSCFDCGPPNGFALRGIEPQTSRPWTLKLVQVNEKGNPPEQIADELQKALEVLPIDTAEVTIPATYSHVIDGDWTFGPYDWRQEQALGKLNEWDERQGTKFSQGTLGLAVAPAAWEAGAADPDQVLFNPVQCRTVLGIRSCTYNRPGAIVSRAGRPYTAVAHELGHGLGRVHAGLLCGGNSDGQVGEKWPPDAIGRVNGVGFDVDAALSGTPRVVSWTDSRDFMTYCMNGEQNAWVSPRGWESMFATLHGSALPRVPSIPLPRRTAHAAAGATLLVRAMRDGDGRTEIVSVRPGGASAAPAGPTYSIAIRDAAGQTLATIPMAEDQMHSDDGARGQFTLLEATVPAAGAESLAILAAGVQVATLRRSAHAPAVRFTAPKAGARVGGTPAVRVAWDSTDEDGDDLLTTLEYSGDGGKSWRMVAETDRGSIDLDRRLLAASRDARLRVTVNDGWNETQALSAKFRSLGAAPAVRVLEPAARFRTANDQAISLAATATDDRDEQLPSSAYTWKLGKRVIGRGDRTTVTGIPAGRRRLVVEARDRLGRVGRASVRIRLSQATPRFTKLVAPRRISRGARRLTFRAATSVPAKLSAGRTTHTLGVRPRRVTVRITPGRRPLGLRLALRAGGKKSRSLLIIKRR
jgi:hypothetical protein